MITKITGETPFQVLTNNFSISPSQEGYTLQISADGSNYSDLFAVSAGQTRMVSNVAANSYYRLKGNNSEVTVNWLKTCVTEGGGGDLSNYYTKSETDAEIAQAVSGLATEQYVQDALSGVNMDNYYTSAQTQTAIDSAITPLEAQIQEISGATPQIDLSDYYTSAQTEAAISAATSGKADAQNVQSPGQNKWLPGWNSQGVITGTTARLYETQFSVNGAPNKRIMNTNGASFPNIYAPITSGNPGEILVSTGSGAPVWSAVTMGGDSSVLKGTMEFPEVAEIGDMISKVYEMPTFWWNDSDNITRKMHIDLDTLDTGETYPVLSFLNEDGEPLYGRLEYNFGWRINFFDEDVLASALTLTSTRAANPSINIPLEDGYYAGIGYLNDDFTGQGGKMLQIGRTNGTWGNWDGTVDEIPEITTEDIVIDGIPGIPSATGPYVFNGGGWVSVAEMAQNGIFDYLNDDVLPRLDDITTLTDDLNDLAAELSEAERVTAVSINDIRDKMVTSMDVKTIVKMSQAAYDALSTKDATTLYIITGTTI